MANQIPHSPKAIERDIYTVSRLNREAKALLEGGLGLLWLEGEISNLARPASGHMYFSIKDAQAQVRCAFFRGAQRGLGFAPEDGLKVLIRARVSLYEARGEFQLIVETMEPSGEGALRRAFEAVKARLLEEGLFDTARKQELPALPKRIGVITSPSGAVLHDIVTTLRRRFPAIPVLVYPVPVQGAGAADEIAAMIATADQRRDCDVLILARGGGSLEDLWSFNEEVVARAIADCHLPLVCGVGHETDMTIADMVADARAPTPTAAAEMLSPNQHDWIARLASQRQRFVRLMQDTLNEARQSLDWTATRLIHPSERIQRLRERLDALSRRIVFAQHSRLQTDQRRLIRLNARLRQAAPPARIQAMQVNTRHLGQRMQGAMTHRLQRQQHAVAALGGKLHALSPLATLERGYSILTDARSKNVVRDARKVKSGDKLRARLFRGELQCTVEDIHDTD
jgi:exodeoxyribonuclease VII large subunit